MFWFVRPSWETWWRLIRQLKTWSTQKIDSFVVNMYVFQSLGFLQFYIVGIASLNPFHGFVWMYQGVCTRVENTWVALFIVYTLLSPVYGRANRIKQFVSHRNRRKGYNQFTWTLTSNRISHTTNTSVTDI